MLLNFVREKYYHVINQLQRSNRAPPLPLLGDGRKGVDILKNRVTSRYRKARRRFSNAKSKESFSDLFNLPEWLDTTGWLTIQLRDRGVDSLYILTLDHIVPLSQARNKEELKKLMSWSNTRLLDKDMNEEKSSTFDAESRYLCYILLGRYPDDDSLQEQNKLRVKQHTARHKIEQNRRRNL